jgi:hypothetical protein
MRTSVIQNLNAYFFIADQFYVFGLRIGDSLGKVQAKAIASGYNLAGETWIETPAFFGKGILGVPVVKPKKDVKLLLKLSGKFNCYPITSEEKEHLALFKELTGTKFLVSTGNSFVVLVK